VKVCNSQTQIAGSIIKFGGYKWRVLDVQNGKTLIIADDIIECRRFDSSSNNWNDCELNRYLNNEFINSFDSESRSKINGDVFLLCSYEANRYFKTDTDLIARFNGSPYWWWLQSSGFDDNDVVLVDNNGHISVSGDYVGYGNGGVRPAMWVNIDITPISAPSPKNVPKVFTDDDFKEYINNGHVEIPYGCKEIDESAFGNKYELTSVIIPNSVTSIGKRTFERCKNLTSITIPDSVICIGDHAFEWCERLTSITIPEGVTSIGDGAFIMCRSLTSVTIPESVTSIGKGVFGFCQKLTSVNVNPCNNAFSSIDGVLFDREKRIFKAFPAGKTETYTILGSVTFIENAFAGCNKITSITIPESVTSIGNRAFEGCINLTSITIPESVISIGDFAFSSCKNLTSIIIPNNVTNIGYGAFGGCGNLTSITIPDSVINIGEYAFEACNNLTVYCSKNSYAYSHIPQLNNLKVSDFSFPKVFTSDDAKKYLINGKLEIPYGYTEISNINKGFAKNYPTSVTIPDSITNIGDFAFSGCGNLTSITIPDSVISIGAWAFSGCASLTSVKIPDSVTSIGDFAFNSCDNITEITIPNGAICIGEAVFSVCKKLTDIYVDIENKVYTSYNGVLFDKEMKVLKAYPSGRKDNYTIPDSVTRIDNQAFSGCTLTAVTIPNSVTSIGNSAFFSCTSLTSLTIPNNVSSIGEYAFAYCQNIVSITIPNSVTSIGKNAFNECINLTIYCSKNSYAYSHLYGLKVLDISDFAPAANDPKVFTNDDVEKYLENGHIQIPYGYTKINDDVFRFKRNELISVTIPNSVTSIGDRTFSDCKNLTSITIPDSVTSIGKGVFLMCSNLTSITIPNSVTSIGNGAFARCERLNSISIPESVTSISENAFLNCDNVTIYCSENSYAYKYCEKKGIRAKKTGGQL